MTIDLEKIRAIDPPGCGCTECIIGEYVPFDHPDIDEVLEAILDKSIELPRNNLNSGTLIIYRNSSGAIQTEINSTMLSRSDIEIIQPNNEDTEDSENIDVSMIEGLPAELQNRIISALFYHEVQPANPTYNTYVVYRSPYGETGIIELYAKQGSENIAIMLYEE